VDAGEEMLTCYSRTYGKRPYPGKTKYQCFCDLALPPLILPHAQTDSSPLSHESSPVAKKGQCADPRCAGVANHRQRSELGLSPDEWREELMSRHPEGLHALPGDMWDVEEHKASRDDAPY
jgi:hypothetical protein